MWGGTRAKWGEREDSLIFCFRFQPLSPPPHPPVSKMSEMSQTLSVEEALQSLTEANLAFAKLAQPESGEEEDVQARTRAGVSKAAAQSNGEDSAKAELPRRKKVLVQEEGEEAGLLFTKRADSPEVAESISLPASNDVLSPSEVDVHSAACPHCEALRSELDHAEAHGLELEHRVDILTHQFVATKTELEKMEKRAADIARELSAERSQGYKTSNEYQHQIASLRWQLQTVTEKFENEVEAQEQTEREMKDLWLQLEAEQRLRANAEALLAERESTGVDRSASTPRSPTRRSNRSSRTEESLQDENRRLQDETLHHLQEKEKLAADARVSKQHIEVLLLEVQQLQQEVAVVEEERDQALEQVHTLPW